jgi:hypothetical protein
LERANDNVLRTIDGLVRDLRSAQDGGFLYLMGQLFFTSMYWLKNYKTDPTAVPECRPPILSLNLFAANELARKLQVPLTGLAGKLQQMYGVEMTPHGVGLDTSAVQAKYLTAAKRETYRVFWFQGRASHYRTVENLFRTITSDQNGLGFALSMSNQLYVGHVGGITVKYHSFFTGGRPVQCAGHMWFNNGVITKVSNSSGHYKPVDVALIKTLNYLRMNGVNLRGVSVEPVQFKKVGKDVRGRADEEVSAELFMKNNGNWNAVLERAKHQRPL